MNELKLKLKNDFDKVLYLSNYKNIEEKVRVILDISGYKDKNSEKVILRLGMTFSVD